MRVAAVQLCSGADKDRNLEVAASLIARAAHDGADLVALPEMFNVLGSGAVLRAGAEPLDGPTSSWASAQAAEHGITLVAGTFIERPAPAAGVDAELDAGDPTAEAPRNHNTCCVYGPDGRRLATYRKIHLFDVDVPGAVYHESEVIAPGDEIVVTRVDVAAHDAAIPATTDSPAAPSPSSPAGSVGLGLSVCYDVRFPELYRILALRGADIVTVPAAFTATTGPPHWEVLVRARAIEDHLFVVAAGQHGSSNERLHWHGHSMIVDPWGRVLAQLGAGHGDGVILADVDLADQRRIRGVLPSVANRRPSAYRWPD
jgi:deaminated glutathione amidase